MSAVAGRMAVQAAAHYLERPQGSRGVLMSGADGAEPARVLVLGAGVVGANATRVALGMGAEVTVLNRSEGALRRLAAEFGPRVRTGLATPETIGEALREADAVVGAALVAGARAPKLVTRRMAERMPRGAVAVDVSIDQGGTFETSRVTTHADPVYCEEGVLHYCVANMPGAVPRTATAALNRATLPHVIALADHGVVPALLRDEHLRRGLNICRGAVTNAAVAEALGSRYVEPLEALAGGG